MNARTIIAAAVSIAILAGIAATIDIHELARYFRTMNLWYLFFSFILLIPIIIIHALRYRVIIRSHYRLSLTESIQLTLVGMSLNIVTPSKLGDFGRAYALQERLPLASGISSIIMEKYLDLFALFSLVLAAGIFVPEKTSLIWIILLLAAGFLLTSALLLCIDFSIFLPLIPFKKLRGAYAGLAQFANGIRRNPMQLFTIAGFSIINWTIQLFQFYLFFLTFRFPISPSLLSLVPIAITIGMIPISFNGIGTRDSAFIFLFTGYAPASLMVGIGLCATLRNLFPGIAGLLFMKNLIIPRPRHVTRTTAPASLQKQLSETR
ncbi:MAG TPA: lysylphosphatidylglycerol synthase transmembrane domain-containing protein [Candidatus Nanoarchaeia archaeon]|nr:lysylphosphatidylglycerol synthase transmembrane domain-containing protein [Candidatus Nanoarchaeia archaeon]